MRNYLKILALGALLALAWSGSASAQQVNLYCLVDTGPPVHWAPCSATNPMQITGSFSATTTGFPGTTQTTGTPISVTTGGVTGTLPTGTVVVASNVGATNGAYCKLGASATTSDQLIPPNSWFAFTIGSNTQLTCITSTSTTTVNMVGGAGLPTGSGGGGGGSGSSGAVFGPTAVGSAAANPPVLIAGTANAGATGNVQVAKVSAGGLVSVDGSAVTQPVSVASAAPVPSAAVESNHVLKNAAGNLVSLTTTIGATSGWVMLFDAVSAPADGAVTPKYCRYIQSNGTGGAASLDWIYPLSFATGITAVFSSTGCFSKTASGTAFFEGQVQ